MSRKDANKPKGRTTAYAYFVMSEKEQYAKVRSEHIANKIRAEHIFLFGLCHKLYGFWMGHQNVLQK